MAYSVQLLATAWTIWFRDRMPVDARFFAPVQTGPEAHPASCIMDTVLLKEVKRPELGVNHPSPSSAKLRERVELYF